MIGGVDLHIPALAGAAYHAEQILSEPEIRCTFRTADGSVEMSSWVAASEDLLVIELTSKGKAVTVEAKPWVQTGDEATTAQGTWKDVQWITRAYTGSDLDWPAKAALAVRCLETDLKAFTLKPGHPMTIAVAIRTSHDTKTHLDDARRRVAQLSRNKSLPPGLYGNWITSNKPGWAGDYHMNYNHEAPWWGCYSGNHIELTEPYDAPLIAFMPRGRFYAKRDLHCRGIYYPVGIGPKGLETTRNPTGYKPGPAEGDQGHFLGQKYNAAYGAVNMSMRFYHTYDLDYARKIYPYLIEVASFWEDRLQFENGRYVIYEDCLNETKKPDDVNPPNCMGVVKLAFQTIIDVSTELGIDADRRRKWQHIVDHFSDFPTYQYKGKKVFNGAEKGQSANGGERGWPIIEHIWPDGQIGLDSKPQLLEISRNTIAMKPSWKHTNCFPMTYTAAARVGYDPNVILENLHTRCRDSGYPNLWVHQYGGGIETVSAVPSSINEMLLQSHEKILRFFPVWPKEMDARFGTLKAVGAFLVSGELKDGQVRHVTIVSEKGRDCTVQNPWPGKAVTLYRNGKKDETLKGNRFSFKTARGERIALVPNE